MIEVLAGATMQHAEAGASTAAATLVNMGGRPIPNLAADAQLERVVRLCALARRLDLPVVPGLTVHQAKGREWKHVGVTLSASDISRLAAGLSAGSEWERKLYVALTLCPARHSACLRLCTAAQPDVR